MIKMILATSSQEDGYAIGKDNKLLWNITEDLAYFKSMTDGGCVVMGRKTYDSLPFKGKGLPNRKNIVFSTVPQKSFMSQDVVFMTDTYHLVQLHNSVVLPFKDLWVIGGASIYKQMLPHVAEIHHTTISGSYPDADKRFNMDFLDNGEWNLYSVEKLCDKATVCVWRRA